MEAYIFWGLKSIMKKDTTTKKVIKTITEDIAKYILDLDISEVEFIDKELQRVEKREADIVAKCNINGNLEILHIEIQNNNDSKMPLRMMRYYTDIKTLYPKLPIRQYLIYIGKDKCYIKAGIKDTDIEFRYNLIDMHTIDCEKLLQMDTPDALVLSILCDFKGRDEREIIKYILSRLRELTDNDEHKLDKYMLILDTLSGNRELQDVVKEVAKMLRDTRFEDLPIYQVVLERGIERGIEKGREEEKFKSMAIMVKRFGLPIEQVSKEFGEPIDKLREYLDKQEI